MKIICTVDEFAKMVRRCNSGSCYNCAFADVCGDNMGIERFVTAENVVSDTEGRGAENV